MLKIQFSIYCKGYSKSVRTFLHFLTLRKCRLMRYFSGSRIIFRESIRTRPWQRYIMHWEMQTFFVEEFIEISTGVFSYTKMHSKAPEYHTQKLVQTLDSPNMKLLNAY